MPRCTKFIACKMKKFTHISFLAIILFGALFSQYQSSILDMKNTARLYVEAGHYVDAIAENEKILHTQESILGKQHLDVASTLNELGELYLLIGDLEIADLYFKDALRIYESFVVKAQTELINPLQNLQEIYSLTEDSVRFNSIEDRISQLTIFDSLHQLGADLTVWQPGEKLLSTEIDSSGFVTAYTSEDQALDLMELGFSYIDRGLFSESIESFSRAVNLHTSNLDAEYFTSLYFGDSLQVKNLLTSIQSRMLIDSTNFGADFIASIMYYTSDSILFNEHIQTYLQHDSTDVRAYRLIADKYYENENWIDALFQYRKILWIEENLDAQFGEAMCLKNLGYYHDAITAFLNVLKQDSYFHEAYYQSGLTFMELEKYDDAISQLTQSLLLDPENKDVYFDLGVSYVRSGQIRQALEAFNRTVKLNPEHGQAYYELGLIHEDLLNLDKAINAYMLARKHAPDIIDVHYRLGMLLVNNDQKKEAMDPLREYVIHNPDSLKVVEVLGDVFISQNRYPEAIDAYSRLREIYPENINYHTAIAESHWQLKEYVSAKYSYKSILEFDDENTEVMYRLGVISNELGEFEEAVDYILSAIDCGTPTMSMYYQLALAYGSMQNYMQAVISFQEALSLAPKDAEIHYQLGVAYQAMEIHSLATNEFNIYINQ